MKNIKLLLFALIVSCSTPQQDKINAIDLQIDSLHEATRIDSIKQVGVARLVNAGLTLEEAEKRYDEITKTK